jgi:nucleotidyltransferase AbiEii toxin of type IV toxin-antitoxin system
MDKVANLPPDDRAALFEETAARANLAAPIIVEKDFWVCWALKRLYSMPEAPAMLFKGGTSLSKCFGLIHRFSEDIDLGLERRDIGLGGEHDPMSKNSRKGYQRALKEMLVTVREYVADALVPAVHDDFTQALGDDFELKLEPQGSENVIMFRYPRALTATDYGQGDYIASVVRLEVGARSDHHPTVGSVVQSYAAEHLPDEFVQPGCRVIAQAPERTLLEKALILHTGNSKGRFSARTSRHAYDLAMMHRAGTTGTATRELYEEVAHHKLVFGDDIHASRAPKERIKVAPEGEALSSMAADYRSMQAMFFSDPPAPTFDEVIAELKALETALNAL